MQKKKYLKKKNQLRYQRFLVKFNIYNKFKNTFEENISQEFRLKNIEEISNYFLEEIRQYELMCRKHKKFE